MIFNSFLYIYIYKIYRYIIIVKFCSDKILNIIFIKIIKLFIYLFFILKNLYITII